MALHVYNSLTRQKEEFSPISPPKVSMYVCGITPYDETHVGHARAYVAFDMIRRYLKYSGFKVTYIQNITDIDDKIIQKSQTTGEKWQDIALKYSESFFKLMEKLNVIKADQYPKATDHIKDMINVIEFLLKKDIAYQINGDVYFDISKFPEYGKLSNKKLDDLLAGARVLVNQQKHNPGDFVLWKTAKPEEPYFDSPWGKGRPGWHIECSAMSNKYLGETFDIHGGGMDLIFPHHENEIAQAEAATGKPFVKYFLHNGFITINKEKMSKSLGNFFTLKDVLSKYDPMAVRLFLLSTHYRSPIDFSDQQLEASQKALEGIKNNLSDFEFLLKRFGSTQDASKDIQSISVRFEKEMDDDFNSAGAISAIFDLIRLGNQLFSENQMDANIPEKIRTMLKIIGIQLEENKEIKSSDAKKLIKEREQARKDKDFAKADEIRVKLEQMGYDLKDTPFGTMLVLKKG